MRQLANVLFLKYVIVNKVSFFKFPLRTEEWFKHGENFYKQWNLPQWLGALDGKHILMQAPANSGSIYCNYKGTFSIVLLAVVDAEYKFMYVDVGCNGTVSDGGVFNRSNLYQALETGTAEVPPTLCLPGRHSQFSISSLQTVHLPWHITLWSPVPSKINQRLTKYSITGYQEHTE